MSKFYCLIFGLQSIADPFRTWLLEEKLASRSAKIKEKYINKKILKQKNLHIRTSCCASFLQLVVSFAFHMISFDRQSSKNFSPFCFIFLSSFLFHSHSLLVSRNEISFFFLRRRHFSPGNEIPSTFHSGISFSFSSRFSFSFSSRSRSLLASFSFRVLVLVGRFRDPTLMYRHCYT